MGSKSGKLNLYGQQLKIGQAKSNINCVNFEPFAQIGYQNYWDYEMTFHQGSAILSLLFLWRVLP